VDGKDEDLSHRANRTITAGTCKTARRVRIASHWEFATNRQKRQAADKQPATHAFPFHRGRASVMARLHLPTRR
jgi:hypothetical protein